MICPKCGFITEKRNLNQNALFHLWMKVLADELGYISIEDVKRDVKREVLGTKPVVNRITGAIEQEDYRTSQMSKKQMSDFMDKVKIWASTEYQIYLPYIGEQGYDELLNHYNQ